MSRHEDQLKQQNEKHDAAIAALGVTLAQTKTEHERKTKDLRQEHEKALAEKDAQHAAQQKSSANSIEQLKSEHTRTLGDLQTQHAAALESKQREHESDKQALVTNHLPRVWLRDLRESPRKVR